MAADEHDEDSSFVTLAEAREGLLKTITYLKRHPAVADDAMGVLSSLLNRLFNYEENSVSIEEKTSEPVFDPSKAGRVLRKNRVSLDDSELRIILDDRSTGRDEIFNDASDAIDLDYTKECSDSNGGSIYSGEVGDVEDCGSDDDFSLQVKEEAADSDKMQTSQSNKDDPSDGEDNVQDITEAYRCPQCGKQFDKRPNLHKHMRTTHSTRRPHVCLVCDRAFKRSEHLTRHARSHIEKCRICGKIFRTQYDLKVHEVTHRSGTVTADEGKLHQCSLCDKWFAKRCNLQKHMKIHTGERPHVCHVCDKAFKRLSHLRNHSVLHDKSKRYKCDVCLETFSQEYTHRLHMSKHHGNKNDTKQKCPDRIVAKLVNGSEHSEELRNDCDEILEEDINNTREKKLGKHQLDMDQNVEMTKVVLKKPEGNSMKLEVSEWSQNEIRTTQDDSEELQGGTRKSDEAIGELPNETENEPKKQQKFGELSISDKDSSTDKKLLKCTLCDKTFEKRPNLWKHMQIHKAVKRHKCKECGKGFVRLQHLYAHASTHSSDKPYVCEICGRGFSQSYSLRGHIRVHKGEKPHKCLTCGKAFSHSSSLNYHMERHVKADAAAPEKKSEPENFLRHMCAICGKCFLRQANLHKHMRVHDEHRPHKCDVCGKGFKRREHARKHQSHHNALKNIPCPECNKAFTDREYLKLHMMVHEPRKLHPCQMCGKLLSSIGSLKQHQQLHSGEKPFRCTECNKDFSRQGNLAIHMKVHTGERPYACTYCDKSFGLSSGLTKHLRTHTGERPYPCNVCGKAFADGSNLVKHVRTHDKVPTAGV